MRLAIIAVDSLERASDALPALEGATQYASREACALLKDGISAKGPLRLITMWVRFLL